MNTRAVYKAYNNSLLASDKDNDAYCVCTHNFSLRTHKRFRLVRTMYAVRISGTQTVFSFMRTQIKMPLTLSQNDSFSTGFVWLLCQQSKSGYSINAAFDRSIHITHLAVYTEKKVIRGCLIFFLLVQKVKYDQLQFMII